MEASDVIGFGATAYFGLAAVVALMLAILLTFYRWRVRAREAFAGPRSRSWPSIAFWPRSLLLLTAAALIVLAAARPQWGSHQLTRKVEGVDLVLVLDISQSMTADDVQPSRIKVAQDNLTTLVQAQRGSRFGLVLFAGNAFLRSPLTADSQAMTQLISRADREAGLTRVGSDIGAALQQAGAILSTSENSGRAVVLVSDGEDFAGSFQAAAQSLADQGIVIHTAGVGTTEGAQLFDVTADGQRVPKVEGGSPVVSRLNEDNLRQISQIGGGQYVRLDGGSSTGLLQIRSDLARLDQTPLGSETENIPVERFQYFVAAALALLLLSWFLPSRLSLPSLRWLGRARHKPILAAVLVLLIAGGCGSNALRERNEAANQKYLAGDYEGALAGYQQLISERPDIDEFSYNAGNSLHRLGAFERAVAETQRALPPLDPKLGAETYYALGNHLLALQRLEEAYVAYRNALLLDPNDQDAKFNLEYALLLIQQRDNPAAPTQEPSQAQAPGEGEGSATPEANGGQQPGAAGTPEPGGTPQPGNGSPGAGSSTPDAGAGSPAAGTPSPGNGGDNGEGGGQTAEDLQRALAEALSGIDGNLTFEQAVQILDLLRQQQERQLPGPGNATGPDY
jgi:Ca-activated chloride channel family protein